MDTLCDQRPGRDHFPYVCLYIRSKIENVLRQPRGLCVSYTATPNGSNWSEKSRNKMPGIWPDWSVGIMGKRSEFKRQPRDFYPTPFECVEPLIQQLSKNFTFTEPCAGDGALCGHLEHWGGRCLWASDLLPHHEGIYRNDYSAVGETELRGSD